MPSPKEMLPSDQNPTNNTIKIGNHYLFLNTKFSDHLQTPSREEPAIYQSADKISAKKNRFKNDTNL
jgi:hypothetical protein